MLKIDIVSGFLGAGKTTFIKRLLKTKLAKEKIVIIENEFGEVNVDSDFLADTKIDIAELSQGCICCSLVGDFAKSLSQVIEQYNPDRIIVEPSGVGKLSDVKKAVIEAGLEKYLNTYVCLVDARKAKVYHKNFKEFFADQIKYAKTVVLSRADITSTDKIMEGINIIKDINPCAIIVTTAIDEISDTELLRAYEGVKNDILSELLDEVENNHEKCHKHHHDEECHCHEHHHNHDEECHCHEHHHDHDEECHCHEHHHDHDEECHCHEHHHHHADEVFNSVGFEVIKTYDLEILTNVLNKIANTSEYGEIIRAKGVVKTNDGWKKFNITPNEMVIEDCDAFPIGKVCVIGVQICENVIKNLF